MEPKIAECSKLIAQHNLTIAFAESATAGWLCSEFALTPDSGTVLMGGITCYDASLKESLLGVPHDIILKCTPESQEVTDELAKRLRKLINADICVGVTGLTTEGGSETTEKPVGTMFVSMMIGKRMASRRWQFEGSCEEIIHQTIEATANLLIEELSGSRYA